MFDGSTKKRQTVSLRGKRKEEDKEEFLYRARIERETRAKFRLKNNSALLIQRVVRGRMINQSNRNAARRIWDQNMSLTAASQHFNPQKSIQLLCYFYQQDLDTERYHKLIEILRKFDYFHFEPKKLIFIGLSLLSKDSSAISTVSYLMNKFYSQKTAENFSEVKKVLCDGTNWVRLGKTKPFAICPTIFSQLKEILNSSKMDQNFASNLCKLALNSVKFLPEDETEHYMGKFGWILLTSSSKSSLEISNEDTWAIIKEIEAKFEAFPCDVNSAAVFLANLIDLTRTSQNGIEKANLSTFLRLFNKLGDYVRWSEMFAEERKEEWDGDSDDDSDDLTSVQFSSFKIESRLKCEEVKVCSAKTFEANETCKNLSEKLSNWNFAEGFLGSAFENWDEAISTEICAFFGKVLINAPCSYSTKTKSKISGNFFSLFRNAVPSLDKIWSASKNVFQSLTRSGQKANETQRNAEIFTALFFFLLLVENCLESTEEEDFYNETEGTLSKQNLAEVVELLKMLLYKFYWADSVNCFSGAGRSGFYMQQLRILFVATKLFNFVYEKDSRRGFLPSGIWYCEDLVGKLIVVPNGNNLALTSDDPEEAMVELFGNSNILPVLANIFQVIPFLQRVSIFRQLIESNRSKLMSGLVWETKSTNIRVRRNQIFEDSFESLGQLSSSLRNKIKVTFVNEHGIEEAGIDGGGVLKEFIDALTKRTFDPKLGLFRSTEDHLLYPAANFGDSLQWALKRFEFAGAILGKALYEGILVEPQFSPAFLNVLLGRENKFGDLFLIDSELHRNLTKLKSLAEDEIEALLLTFSITVPETGEVVDMVRGGREFDVNKRNVHLYTKLFAHYRLNIETLRQTKAFLKGFRCIVPLSWLRLFGLSELQRLVGGDEKGIDLSDLKRHTLYGGGYHPSQPIIQWLWEVLEGFNVDEQAQFLKFVTSCSRQPLLGFKHLNPPFCVNKVPSGERGDKLPSSSTCVNLLKLPNYGSKKVLREKLWYAMTAGAGFELT